MIDTSGAYIPGHGTPTVILLGRDRAPVGDEVRTVMGIKGEPSTPNDPSKGLVWTAIVSQVDRAGSESEWVSSADAMRDTFSSHPWSVGGGCAGDLKDAISVSADLEPGSISFAIRFVCITKADDVLTLPRRVFAYGRVPDENLRPFGIGEEIRNWTQEPGDVVFFPYDLRVRTRSAADLPNALRFLWPYRSSLYDRKVFSGQTYREAGKPWYEYGQIPIERFAIPASIPFAFVSTHNHFVLDRGGKVFKQSAPVIKLPAGATEDDHLALIGLLNSSTAMFWMKQVTHGKGQGGVGQESRAEWEEFREFTGTGLKQFPVADEKPLDLAAELDRLARELAACSPAALLSEEETHYEGTKRTKEEQSE